MFLTQVMLNREQLIRISSILFFFFRMSYLVIHFACAKILPGLVKKKVVNPFTGKGFLIDE